MLFSTFAIGQHCFSDLTNDNNFEDVTLSVGMWMAFCDMEDNGLIMSCDGKIR